MMKCVGAKMSVKKNNNRLPSIMLVNKNIIDGKTDNANTLNIVVFLKVYLSSDAIKERQTVTIHKFADVVGLARLHEMNGIVVNAKTDRIRIDDENIQKLFGK